LIDYANWAIRYVAPRPRKVIVEQTASIDPRWGSLKKDIDSFLEKVERGEDRAGSVCLNSRVAAAKWISAMVMPQPGLAAAQ
jgi:hypothetical protein